MIITIAVCAGAFGAVLGSYRGGVQMLYAGVKLPIVVLLTAVLTTPVLVGIRMALGQSRGLERDMGLVLSALALGSLILAAWSPVVLLAILLGVSYHVVIMLIVGCCSVSGLVGLSLLLRGLGSPSLLQTAIVTLTVCAVFCTVGSQLSWTLRPYLVRPRTEVAPFVRSIEGSFLESVWTSSRSARGIYDEPAQP